MLTWNDSKDNVRPSKGAMILFATWYDGWNYGVGYYVESEDKVYLNDSYSEEDCTKLDFSDFETWMEFEEPNVKL